LPWTQKKTHLIPPSWILTMSSAKPDNMSSAKPDNIFWNKFQETTFRSWISTTFLQIFSRSRISCWENVCFPRRLLKSGFERVEHKSLYNQQENVSWWLRMWFTERVIFNGKYLDLNGKVLSHIPNLSPYSALLSP
jgi:hypothetical protein